MILEEGEKAQRLRDIEAALRAQTRMRAVLDETPDSPERSADIDAVKARIQELRAERAELTGSAPEPDSLRAYVGRINARLMEMERETAARHRAEASERIRRQRLMNVWMLGMSALLAVELAAIVWIAAHVF